jgi:pimeloyl-ACP methyl ester carboxylesterase
MIPPAWRLLALRQRAIPGVFGLILLFWPAALPAETLDPVVFVPGILGSRLEDDKGVVWGDVLPSLTRFSDLELPLDPQKNRMRASGILNTLGVFGPFKIGQYDGLMKTFAELGFREKVTLFVFPYDWRQSNFETAARLRDFVEGEQALAGRKINIVAHSMGGLVARIYVQQLGGAGRVNRVVTLGTPHLGSPESLGTFLNGMGRFKNFAAGGETAVKRVVFSFSSMYELLPAYRGCCVVGVPGASGNTLINVLDRDLWTRFGWAPPEYRVSPRKEFMERALERAAELQRLVTQPLPGGVRFFKIAGDLINTTTRVYLDPASGRPLQWDRFGGDGTVPVISATADDATDADSAIQIHATIFNDDHVKVRLKRILTTDTRLDRYAFRGTTGFVIAGPDNALVPFELLDISQEDAYYATGQAAQVRVRAQDAQGQPIRGVKIQAWLERASGQVALAVAEDPSGTSVVSFQAPDAAGVYRVLVNVPGVGLFEDYVVALPREER